MPPTSDAIQQQFEVGDVVNVPITVTAVGGTPARPTVTGTTTQPGFDGNTDSIGPLDAIQVIKDN